MTPLDTVALSPLTGRTRGRREVVIGLIDGPVALDHPDLANSFVRQVSPSAGAACSTRDSVACTHGTFVAGILCARRGSDAPAICPECTLHIRPIFSEAIPGNGDVPSATPDELAQAINECVDSGARVLNLSAALTSTAPRGGTKLEQALDYAASRGVIPVAAAGNQGTVGGSIIIRHSAVIPVAACDLQGRPLNESNLGNSIGKRGLMAPGIGITSLGTNGKPRTLGGTSAAAPFVTGAIALLWSEFLGASAAEIRLAVTRLRRPSRHTVVPPLLDAWGAYEALSQRGST